MGGNRYDETLPTEKQARPMPLRDEITAAINRHSRESASDTPDFILAEYLMACLDAFERAVCMRENWYGRLMTPARVAEAQAMRDRGDSISAIAAAMGCDPGTIERWTTASDLRKSY